MKISNLEYLRSAFFGIEDALVSTTGAVIGIAAGSQSNKVVLMASLVVISVEAMSMGVGEFFTDETVLEAEKKKKGNKPLLSAILMFFSYLLAGLIPVSPFIFTNNYTWELSLIFAALGLFLLGFIKAKIVHVPPIKSGIKLLFIGSLAAVIGIMVGLTFKTV